MKNTLLLLGIMMVTIQASAEVDLIKCSSQSETSYSQVRIYETSLGKYGFDVFRCQGDCRDSNTTYYNQGDIRRRFSGNRPAMLFSSESAGIVHFFGEYMFADEKITLTFRDSDCVVTHPKDKGLIVGFADLEPGVCGLPTEPYESLVRADALENAQRQCPLGDVEVLQTIEVESFCKYQGKGNLYLRAAGLFKCKHPR